MSRPTHRFVLRILAVAALSIPLFANEPNESSPPSQAQAAAPDGLAPILSYISNGWDTLTRSMTDCTTIVDPKITAKSILYVPADFIIPDNVRALEAKCNVEVKPLPKVIHHPGEVDTNAFYPHGLLYLEHPYVVPGGRFNEMYGWDSYFIIRGLVQAGKLELARGMIENFFFEIDHYGSILNANRTYYLSRSQPPFLTSMILSVYNAQKSQGKADRAWLERAYAYAVRDHAMWNTDPHLAGDTALSRYYDFGDAPAPESLKDETDHYQKVAVYFIDNPDPGAKFLVGRKPNENPPDASGGRYNLELCDVPMTMARTHCENIKQLSLTRDYYRGDRSMRESGFDVSFRFAPFGAATHHFAPVCLNSLIYKTEKDLEEIARTLGKNKEADEWKTQAAQRQKQIVEFNWDSARGEFFDYNFTDKKRSDYEYASTFYPLWAGLATPEQAAAVVKNLSHFEKPGGLLCSPYFTGGQWDAPYAWAPLQLVAVEGLRRYGFATEANRLSFEFLSTIAENFRRDGNIREKYNAVERSADASTTSGYSINVIGFGWSNAIFLVFMDEMPKSDVDRLAKDQVVAKH
ncbi:MAG TPA: trehalase family glycosidase [Dongiaceae bacterium]|nr:trehalase family glycosidase [Dongiaceae bacterium]